MKYFGVAASGCAPDRSIVQLKSKVILVILVIFPVHFFILLLVVSTVSSTHIGTYILYNKPGPQGDINERI
jgi:hypothetical protein